MLQIPSVSYSKKNVHVYVKEGIGRERLGASLAQAEFNLREGDFGYYPDGVALAMQALSSWLYDDTNATAYLHYEEAIANRCVNI